MRITSFKSGSRRKNSYGTTEHCKDIFLLTQGKEMKVGLIAKSWSGDWREYRVYFLQEHFPVKARSTNVVNYHNQMPNEDESSVLMETFTDLSQANAYAKRVFQTNETLKKEMFNVYLKLLQPLG